MYQTYKYPDENVEKKSVIKLTNNFHRKENIMNQVFLLLKVVVANDLELAQMANAQCPDIFKDHKQSFCQILASNHFR